MSKFNSHDVNLLKKGFTTAPGTNKSSIGKTIEKYQFNQLLFLIFLINELFY